MTELQAADHSEALIFFRRWLKHPLRMGAVIPSSPALTRLVSRQVALRENCYAVELGAGTGCVTRSLLESGVPEDRLIVIELDPELCAYLRKTFPQLKVIHGNAIDLPKLLPEKCLKNVSTVISGMPMTNMTEGTQRKIIDACFKVMESGGDLLQYTYRPLSPISADRFGLEKKRVGFAFKNLPPASVWRYQKTAA